jgi:nicotinate dehydrogenase subunit B
MALPQTLVDNPRLDQWLGFATRGQVRVSTGKVELGQGILTALVQIAADELDVAVTRIALRSGDTRTSPSEGYTAGSVSVEQSGGALRLVAAEVRALMLAEAARRLACAPRELSVTDGAIRHNGAPTGIDYWHLAPALDLARPATVGAVPKAATARRIIGTSLPRVDLSSTRACSTSLGPAPH